MRSANCLIVSIFISQIKMFIVSSVLCRVMWKCLVCVHPWMSWSFIFSEQLEIKESYLVHFDISKKDNVPKA